MLVLDQLVLLAVICKAHPHQVFYVPALAAIYLVPCRWKSIYVIIDDDPNEEQTNKLALEGGALAKEGPIRFSGPSRYSDLIP